MSGITRIIDKTGVIGAIVGSFSCAVCFPAAASLGAAIGLGFLSHWEGLFVHWLIPIFAAVALLAGTFLAGQDEPFCIIMVESRAAVADLEQTLAVPGVEGIYVGPRDLSYSLGCPLDPNDPVLHPALEQIWAGCAAAGKPVGVHATDGPTARLYRENGCRLVNVAADGLAITRTAAANLDAARQ